MNTPKAVSDYMRGLQLRSAEARWGGLSAAERSVKMKALRAKTKRKPKRVARRSNVEVSGQSGRVKSSDLGEAQCAHSDSLD